MDAKDLEHCLQALEAVAANSLLLGQLSLEQRVRLFKAAGQVLAPDKAQVRRNLKAKRSLERRKKEEKDRQVRAATSIRVARLDAVFVPPPRQLSDDSSPAPRLQLEQPRDCYVCKSAFTEVHFFYDSMCPPCAKFNYEKRFQTASLEGRVALITGARLKIGYQAALMLLRAGARVIVTTRFPQDAALRFAREKDFGDWRERLRVHGLDLRNIPVVEAFTSQLEGSLDRLDFLINNAAQTVKRPPAFYRHLLEIEAQPLGSLPREVRPLLEAHRELELKIDDKAETDEFFPAGQLDADLQQRDYRKMNSWRMRLADVPTSEMLEVQLVNSVAPFVLCSKLKALMLRAPGRDKHIVNVSAMEGKFARHTKTDKHPHTNMAKAALNMLTLTSARDYVRDGIHMNAVDTGWVTDEDPAELSARKQERHDFQPPLDIVDGAARVCDPIFSGMLTGKHSWGNFLKDYQPTEW